MNLQNAITEEIFNNISKCIENAISTHLDLNSSARNIVSEDVLFDYDAQFKLLLSKHSSEFSWTSPYYPPTEKLSNVQIIQKVKEALKIIGVKLHLSNSNTYNNWNNLWFQLNKPHKASFYTNTNLIVEICMVGMSATVRIFTQDNKIDFIYGYFNMDGSIRGLGTPMGPMYVAEKELIDCQKMVYKYIHPHIYLDYYMFCATEKEMNELIFRTSLVKLLNNIEKENNTLVETTKTLKKELQVKNDEYNKEIIIYHKCNNSLEYENEKLKENIILLKNEIIALEDKNKSLVETKENYARNEIKLNNELTILNEKMVSNDIKCKTHKLFNCLLVVIIAIIYYKS